MMDIEKLEVEKVTSEILIPDKTQKDEDLDSSVRHLFSDKGQLIQNMCHHKLENIKAMEEQSNSQLEGKAQDVDKLMRKNAILLLVLKLCLERENHSQTEIETLTMVDNSLLERKQHTELELDDAKKAELNRHLKEIAARNDKLFVSAMRVTNHRGLFRHVVVN
eukprot:TRINITY_DN2848_c0_g1_i2.p1 TRINITY_DN2848_c0_g1~~TRINITY_DN2848_c0_g1_i2.p1  ORF type:complete len:164 (+),score=29.98 TRINITY_DN2848_c0_g1_i2:64-555(+)